MSCCRTARAAARTELLQASIALDALESRVSRVKSADEWKDMPKGWDAASRKKFWESLVGKQTKHKVTACMGKMKGKVDDEGAYCAALADRVDPGWRSR